MGKRRDEGDSASLNRYQVIAASLGLILVIIGCAVTVWAMAADKSLSAVGIGGLFTVGVLLIFAGFLGITPQSLAFTKEGATLQFVAEAVKDVKQSAEQGAKEAATNPELLEKIKAARTDEDAQEAAASIAETITSALPPTADVTGKVLRQM